MHAAVRLMFVPVAYEDMRRVASHRQPCSKLRTCAEGSWHFHAVLHERVLACACQSVLLHRQVSSIRTRSLSLYGAQKVFAGGQQVDVRVQRLGLAGATWAADWRGLVPADGQLHGRLVALSSSHTRPHLMRPSVVPERKHGLPLATLLGTYAAVLLRSCHYGEASGHCDLGRTDPVCSRVTSELPSPCCVCTAARAPWRRTQKASPSA